MNDYGERVEFPEPFRLDMLDQRSHRNGMVYWRLSIGEQVIGYTSTADPSTPTAMVVERLFTERARTAAAWQQDPDVLIRRNTGQVQAMFQYPSDAQAYLEKVVPDYSRDSMVMETLEGRKVVGVSGHGHRILEALERADRNKDRT